jgi:hypothetical protein
MEPKTLEEAKEMIAGLQKTVADKDVIIAQKNNDIIGIRKNTDEKMRKLNELSEEEKKTLSEKEIELHNAALDLQSRQEAFEATQKEHQNTQRLSTRDKILKNYVGNDEVLFKKLQDNFDMIKGSDEVFTEDQIAGFADTAFNMLGNEKPENPVMHNVNGDNGRAPTTGEAKADFAETPEGQGLAGMLNLQQAKPDANAGK